MKEIVFKTNNSVAAVFRHDGHAIWLAELFGMSCAVSGQNAGPQRGRGLTIVDTDRGTYEGDVFIVTSIRSGRNSLTVNWAVGDSGLVLAGKWDFDPDTSVIKRRDVLTNNGKRKVTIYQCQARFVFTPGIYEVYSQACRWAGENQGSWQTLRHCGINLYSEGGRTVQGASPFSCIRMANCTEGVAFHIVPVGNYEFNFSAPMNIGSDGSNLAKVELGLAGKRLRTTLAPGKSIELPEILLTPAKPDTPHLETANLHKYINDNYSPKHLKPPPIVYNTWFYDSQHLNVELLRKQLQTAKSVGCEVFTVDAGWYGQSEKGGWFEQAGDWREKLHDAFRGKMADFADEVRAAGLGFGLWMEPERVNPSAPIVKKHPQWFVPCKNGYYYPNLHDRRAYGWLRGEIDRLVATYKLAWLKLDFNFDLDTDPSGAELHDYYIAWYRLLSETRSRYPNLYLEGCASGGMRLDIKSLSYFDNHFLSDTVNPFDAVRIYEGAILRAVPGRLGKWAVLRPLEPMSVTHGAQVNALTPSRAGWESPLTVDVDFAIRVAMAGALGFSGDIASLQPEVLERLAWHISFYKARRKLITNSVAHLLTPPRPLEDRTGWSAVQLQDARTTQSILFAYRLDDGTARMTFKLKGLIPHMKYRVSDADGAFNEVRDGISLSQRGVEIVLNTRNRAAVVDIVPQKR
jgi:alpha-galactosidase